MKYLTIWRVSVLSCLILCVSFRHTVPTWLCIEFYKLSMKPSWTLCTLFIDALWLWSCWLCSQCCWCFISGRTRLIILSHILSVSSFHIVFLCLWCFCAVISLYDANNAFIFSISLVIKKFFHAVYSWTQHFMFHLWKKTAFCVQR